MKFHRFFVAESIKMSNTPLEIPSLELVNQLKRVLRLPVQSEIIVFDNSGTQFLAKIERYNEKSVSLSMVEEQSNDVHPSCETWLFAAIVKKDTFEWIVEKATELGVSHIVPIISARTEKKDLKMERMIKVSIEAAEQSGRATVPKIYDIEKLSECLEKYKDVESIVWEPTAPKFAKENLAGVRGIYIGPEGGWTKEELELFAEKKIQAFSLGPQILRAETAVIAALSQIVF